MLVAAGNEIFCFQGTANIFSIIQTFSGSRARKRLKQNTVFVMKKRKRRGYISAHAM